MADIGGGQKTGDDANLGYNQALKYGQDLARLYTQEKLKRRDLQLANQKLQAILETAPNGLAMLDEAMAIVESNPRFEALVEQIGSCVGRPLIEVLPSEQLITNLESASREGKRFAEFEVTLFEPVVRAFHVSGAPLSAGNQRGWVISLHDITERKRLEGLKEEFINIAAHELRTPLAIILGYASVLREDLGDMEKPVTLAAIDAIIKSSDRLTMVIDELVGFAAAKGRSADDVASDRFDLRKVVEHAADSVSHHANLKQIDISLELGEEPLMVSGDRVILAQSVGHLLDNAIKFNRPRGHIQVRAIQGEEDVTLEVRDTGIGIPLTDQQKIFGLFYQVEGHMTRAEGGLGIGLAIAQRGVELHGGHIDVESTLGQGSCFRVFLPSSVEQVPISSQTRLDTAHQQTLAYGRDLARAVTAEQKLLKRLNQASALSHQLLMRLEQMARRGSSEEIEALLDEAHALNHHLADETP